MCPPQDAPLARTPAECVAPSYCPTSRSVSACLPRPLYIYNEYTHGRARPLASGRRGRRLPSDAAVGGANHQVGVARRIEADADPRPVFLVPEPHYGLAIVGEAKRHAQ